MSGIEEQLRRLRAKEALRAEFEHTLEQRADRYLEAGHHGIIPNHHFAGASAECLNLYRDGYFLSTVMVSQSVAEGVFRFIVEHNGLALERERPEIAKLLVDRAIISEICAAAFLRIWRSFRNDVHHMNPKVTEVPFRELARQNIADLAAIEREVFAFRVNQGKLAPVHATYWDLQPDGSIPVFLRLE